MKKSIRTILTSTLLRVLEMEPSLKVADAIERVLQLVPSLDILTSDLKVVEQYLTDAGENLRQRAVVNPILLTKVHNFRHHFFLIDTQPGWLRHLIEQTKSMDVGISHYTLYGRWDALLILNGTEDEAINLHERIQSPTFYDSTYFIARSVPYFHRYKTETAILKGDAKQYNLKLVNRLIDKYDTLDIQLKKNELEDNNVILGPTWTLESLPTPRVSAFVGISLKGGGKELYPKDVLEALLKDETLKTCLVHLYEIERGYPFHYFASLVCQDMEELDKATNAIGFTHIDRVRLEGNTFIVASGKTEIPTLRLQRATGVSSSVDLRYVNEVANQIISRLGTDSVVTFNGLDGTRQLIILRSLDELNRQANKRTWDDERENNIRKAIDSFARACFEGGANGVHMTGAVGEITTTVEVLVKHALRQIVESVYGRDYARAQQELKLPTRDFRRISLGKAFHAFRTIKKHKDFAFLASVLEDDWLDRLECFSEVRNTWAHGGVPSNLTGDSIIDEARRALVEGIELIRWIEGSILQVLVKLQSVPPKVEVRLPERRDVRKFGIFISHSMLDKYFAERIATGLKALNYPVWYADWAIAPSESIVQKINEGLARNDTLVILLSPNSVNSKWVQQELNSTLMAKLSGQNVVVVPVLIAECDIPAILKDVKYIDSTQDFQTGFIKLLEFLRGRVNIS